MADPASSSAAPIPEADATKGSSPPKGHSPPKQQTLTRDHLHQGLPAEKDKWWRVATADGETTLADVRATAKAEKRKVQEEGDAQAQHSRKINITNYTSEDSYLTTKKLHTYYCSICGLYALISAQSLEDSPFRELDESYVMREEEAHKRTVNYDNRTTNIRRKNGIEVQWRFNCRECTQPMGYRTAPKTEKSPYCYYWNTSLVTAQSKCAAFLKEGTKEMLPNPPVEKPPPVLGPFLPGQELDRIVEESDEEADADKQPPKKKLKGDEADDGDIVLDPMTTIF